MSHATVVVIAENREEVSRLMAPFDENLDVPEYQRECSCRGSAARKLVREAIDNEFGSIESNRNVLHASPGFKEMTHEQVNARWAEITAERFAKQDRMMAEIAGDETPIPDCDDCHGTGSFPSTYNPQSKWDWFEIGGRYEGVMGSGDVSPLKNVDSDFVPFAFITPDGVWHQKARLGWWGMTTDEKGKDMWIQEWQAARAQCVDSTAFLVDFHI